MRRYRIGRADTNDIVLEEPSVSREHAELINVSRWVFQLRDLGSTYGTSARHGSDWHLVTAEDVNYNTPVRIGKFETTVAHLLRELDPLAVYMESPEPPWSTPGSRLSPDARAQRPETVYAGWGPGGAPTPLFPPQLPTAPPHAVRPSRRFLVLSLIYAGAIVTATLMVAVALG